MIDTEYSDDCLIRSNTAFKNIVYAGQATIILEAPSGKSHSYRIVKPKEENAFPEDVRFVYAIHQDKLFYVGMIERNAFKLTRSSRFASDTEIVKGAFYLSKILNDKFDIDDSRMLVYHSCRCAKCGRKLTNSKALATGLGKKCLPRVYHYN